MKNIGSGNAEQDGAATKGWLLGHFVGTDSLHHSDDVEIKWGVHKAGETRAEWVRGEVRTTVAMLVSGEFNLEFPDQAVNLKAPGDYVIWGHGVDHKWEAVADSVLITIRWPSATVA